MASQNPSDPHDDELIFPMDGFPQKWGETYLGRPLRHSRPGEDPDPQDPRNHVPVNQLERHSIGNALLETFQGYKKLTDGQDPVVDKGQSYASQWNSIQQQLQWYRARNYPGHPVPRLPWRVRWDGGLNDFNPIGGIKDAESVLPVKGYVWDPS